MASRRPTSAAAAAATPAAGAHGRLPPFVEPMLASPGEAFDSDEYLFEIKWDGTRAMAYVDGAGQCRLVNRRKVDITSRYPELSDALAPLPAGTLLDGEVVVLGADGKPDFSALQSRDHAGSGRAAAGAAARPATFVAFDQLYSRYRPIMSRPCTERRNVLGETLARVADGRRVLLSQGVVGAGKAHFERACEQSLEGVVGKRLASPYLPGKRTDAWVKIKRQEVVHCVVIGFVPEGVDDFGALIVATTDAHGRVRCVGKVGTGFDARRRARVNRYLWSHLRDRPVVEPGKYAGLWVEPGLYCAVRCMERTAGGQLRAPAVVEVYDH